MTVSRTHHRPTSRRLALTALIAATLLSGACATEPEQDKGARRASSYGTGIVSMEQVQRAMEMNRRAAEAAAQPAAEPAPVPVEVSAPAPEVTTTPRPRPRARTTPAPHDTAPVAVASAPAPASAAPSTAVAPSVAAATVVPAPAPVVDELPRTSLSLDVAASDEGSPIYSRDDQDVTPARLVTAQGNGGLDASITDINTMELVISKLGRVEEVKLAAPAKRMTDMVLLSSAKMWKFIPAMRNGQPVRYRTRYSWETTR